MSVFFDIFLLAVIIITIIGGWRRGFIRSIMGLASAVLSFFAAIYFTPALSAYLNEKFFMGKISAEISETLSSLLGIGGTERTTEQLFADMPEAFSSIAERFGVDIASLSDKFSSGGTATEETVEKMSQAMAEPVVSALSSAVAFLLLFIASLIILKIITAILNMIFELPVLKQFNSLLGLIFGIICALFYAIIFNAVAVALVGVLHSFDPAVFPADLISQTILVKLFSNIKISILYEALL